MKRAIQFGAGNIGRGFIGAVLEQGGYHVTFADVNMEVIDRINADGKYVVKVMDVECQEQVISNISGVNSTTDAVVEEIAQADLITTAVGVVILPRIAPAIARGIKLRRERGVEQPLNIIACENAVRASSQLRQAVVALLEGEDAAYCERWVGFPDCSVDRIVPPVRTENPIDVVVEAFYEWNVEQAAFVGEVPHIAGMNLADNLLAYVERKLFTLNTGHAITAYLGCLKGYSTIDESIADEQIYATVHAAMCESGLGLIAKHGFDKEAHFKYIDKIIGRFKNPYLKDDVTRVGREPLRKLSATDRLINPTVTAIGAGVEVSHLVKGIAAALHYNNAEDGQSVELQKLIAEVGVREAVVRTASLDAASPLVDAIVAEYATITTEFAK
ncbi:MAG: mannitol-1-phosphate 5-dehydrogenase [Alistipes sp.]|nr:mannitol-1-phosphate 5-dehydrogenase [Alistipes sp.]